MTIYYTHKYKELGLSSHELLEAAISDYIGDSEKAKELAASVKRDTKRDHEGKPYIEGFDKFSISHSDGSWAVLISGMECGLDIQYERGCDFVSIARRFFSSEDATAVGGIYSMGGAAEAESKREFFRIWTRREAFIKAIGSTVVRDDYPAVGFYKSAVHEGMTYYISNIEIPDAPEAPALYAAICLDAAEDINEKLVYKEMYVKS